MPRGVVRFIQVMNAVSLTLFILCCLHSIHSNAEPRDGAITVVQEVDKDDTTVEVNGEGEEDNMKNKEQVEEFIPTHEWQTIKEGQAIPPGLHIQMSLKTGKKEAKLMDGDSGERYWKSKDDREGMVNADGKQFSKEELKRALKDFKITKLDETDLQREEEVKAKFRSYDELKKEFEAINMNVETDGEIVTKLVDQLKMPDLDRGKQLAVMTDLEYYLHQIDNAILFKDLGGIPLILKAVNNTKDMEMQIEAAMVLGTASSLNPKVQVGAIEAGGLQILLPILSTSPSVEVQRKMLFAMSTICRNFPFAQKRLLQLGGLSAMQRLVKNGTSVKLKIKALTFLSDLLAEKVEVETTTDPEKPTELEKLKQYQLVSVKEAMVEQGWCELVPSLLLVPEHDSRDKVLSAMKLLGPECKEKFLGTVNTLQDLKSEYAVLAKSDDEDSDVKEYFSGLLSVVSELLTTFQSKEEL